MAKQQESSKVDVLIVGAGPAGLMLANWLSRTGVTTRIVDKRGTKIFNGQADGMQSRTLEIFDSFGFGHRAWYESNHMLEMCLWNPDHNGKIQRTDRIIDTIQNLSRFQQAVLHQGRIERFLLDSISEHSDIRVERLVLPEKVEIAEPEQKHRNDNYPISVTIRHLAVDPAAAQIGVENGFFRSNLSKDDTEDILAVSARREDEVETVQAKYLVGCDGAHSWVRKQLGPEFALVGDSTDYVWGVIDVIPITDFPDIRTRCAIHSENTGSMMIIPRENKLTRLYIQLKSVIEAPATSGGRVDRSAITPETILEAAQKIIAPYKLTYKHCDWWTAYQIGQRMSERFSLNERVFLAGDAVHTHSPKAGQGMNVSMQDTYNLGWKLSQVIHGYADPIILKTYQSERRHVAKQLIEFDRKFSKLFSGRPAKDIIDSEGVDLAEFKKAFETGNMFTSGIGVNYGKSVITAKDGCCNEQGDGTDVMCGHEGLPSRQDLASKVPIGMRIPSFKVLNQADARPWHLQELLKSNGSWRLLIFAGDILNPTQRSRVETLATALADPKSFVRRFQPAGKPVDTLIEILTIHSSKRTACTVHDLPEIFHPYSEEFGWDYWKIFVDDQSYHEGHGHAYLNYGIDPMKGCAIIVRPDQHVSWIGELEDTDLMDKFFSKFLIEQNS
ncbi:FAD binding domain protein [Leptodontidium sp. MPI-SDFR-AT-0119]|nr:FAD binding domain protein [Leptodontidium sp. MPI-SDFR-AT-0119]